MNELEKFVRDQPNAKYFVWNFLLEITMGNNQRFAMTETANFVQTKSANRDVRRKCILFSRKA